MINSNASVSFPLALHSHLRVDLFSPAFGYSLPPTSHMVIWSRPTLIYKDSRGLVKDSPNVINNHSKSRLLEMQGIEVLPSHAHVSSRLKSLKHIEPLTEEVLAGRLHRCEHLGPYENHS